MFAGMALHLVLIQAARSTFSGASSVWILSTPETMAETASAPSLGWKWSVDISVIEIPILVLVEKCRSGESTSWLLILGLRPKSRSYRGCAAKIF